MAEYDRRRGAPADSLYQNKNMDKHVIRKFDKEYEAVTQEVIAIEDEEGEEQQEEGAFNFRKLMIALQELSFLPENVVEDSNDHNKLQELWAFLHGEEKGSVNVEDLRVVLLILIGVKPPGREKKPEGEEAEGKEESGPGEEGDKPSKPDSFYEDGKLFIRKGRTQGIFVQFKDLYINRIEAHGRMQLAKL